MSVQVHIGDYFALGGGQFDSRYRYLRNVANPADKTFNMVRGQSLAHDYATVGSNNSGSIIWTWQCNGVSIFCAQKLQAAYPAKLQYPVGFNTGLNVTL